jgi:hypothetical protein
MSGSRTGERLPIKESFSSDDNLGLIISDKITLWERGKKNLIGERLFFGGES